MHDARLTNRSTKHCNFSAEEGFEIWVLMLGTERASSAVSLESASAAEKKIAGTECSHWFCDTFDKNTSSIHGLRYAVKLRSAALSI